MAGAQDPERVLGRRSGRQPAVVGRHSRLRSVAAMTLDPPRRRRPARRGDRATATPSTPTRRGSTGSTSIPVPDGDTGTNMALTLDVGGRGARRRRRRPGRGVQGDQPRLAHGRPGQLRRDPLADPPGHRRAWWPTPTAFDGHERGRRRSPRRPTAAYERGDAAGRGHDPHRRPRGGRGGRRRRPTAAATSSTVLEAARAAGRRRARAHARACCRCSRRPGWSTPAAPGSCSCSTCCSTSSTAGRCPSPTEVEGAGVHASRCPATPSGGEHGDIADLRYEVMYFLEAPDDAIPAFKDVWAGIGDSIVVVGGDGIWNCHIHTDDIGASIEAAIDIGPPRKIRVTDLLEQVEEERWVREAAERRRRGAGRTAHAGHLRGRRRGHRRRHPPHLPLARRAGDRHRRPVDEPVDRRAARGGRGGAGRPGRDPAEQQEHHPGGRAGRRPHRPRPCASCPPRGIAEGFAALLAYDPEADGDDNADEMAEAAAQRRRRRGHPGRARLDAATSARSPRATGSASPATASARSSADLGRRRHRAARRAGRRRATRSSRSSRARAPAPAPPAASPSGWPSTAPAPTPRSTTAASRSTRTSSASSSGRRRLARPRRAAGHRPEGRRARSGPRRSTKIEIETVLDLLTHYPRRYIDKTKQSAIRDLRGRRGDLGVRPGACRRHVGPGPRTRQGPHRAPHHRRLRLPADHVLQPAVARPPAPRGHRGDVLRQGHRVPGPAADGEPGDRPARRGRPAADRRHLPAVRQGCGSTRRTSAAGSARRCGAPASSSTRCPTWVLDRLDLVDRTAAFRGIHLPETMREARGGPRAGSCSTSCSASSSRSCCASGASRRPARASSTTSTATLVRPLPRRGCRSSSPATRRR